MKQQAVEKIQREVAGANAPYISAIGEMLLVQLEATPTIAEQILVEGKTLVGAMSAMTSVARSQAVNNMAVLTAEQGFKIVLEYYEIEVAALEVPQVPVAPVVPKEMAPKAPKKAKNKKPSKKVVQFPGQKYVQTTLDDFFSEGEF